MKRRDVVRLSLVRFATSFLVVLLVNVLNRIMIVELGIGRTLVGLILSILHLVTPFALYFGHLSDNFSFGRFKRIPFIVVGMLLCCIPMPFLPDIARNISPEGGSILFLFLGVISLIMIGFGVTISTIAVHALIVDKCKEEQRGEAMTRVWIVTLIGFIIASPIYSWLIPTYNHEELRIVFLGTAILVFIVTLIGVVRQEKSIVTQKLTSSASNSFGKVFKAISSVRDARIMFLFIALIDFFFFSQEYVLEAFGEEVFTLSVAYTTSFGLYMGLGILISMISVSAFYNIAPKTSEKTVIMIGCIVASSAFGLLAFSTMGSAQAIILLAVFILGSGKGMVNVGMARLMVKLTRTDLSGTIMAFWAVVGGLAIGIGELSGAFIVDLATKITGSIPMGYGILFLVESVGLILCLILIIRFNFNRYREDLEMQLPSSAIPDLL